MKKLSSQEDGHVLAEDVHIDNGQPKYGNLIVFHKSIPHLSIGPDYPFTIFALIFLAIISYALFQFEKMLNFGVIGKAINIFFVVLPPLSFIFTVLGNPGIYSPYQNDDPKIKYCQTCRVFKPKKVYHCTRCNICIEQFDHHCPWMSKCIGKKNLKCFYLFIVSLPSAFFYFGYMIYTAFSVQQQPQ